MAAVYESIPVQVQREREREREKERKKEREREVRERERGEDSQFECNTNQFGIPENIQQFKLIFWYSTRYNSITLISLM